MGASLLGLAKSMYYISYISTSFLQISFSLGFKMLPYDPQ